MASAAGREEGSGPNLKQPLSAGVKPRKRAGVVTKGQISGPLMPGDATRPSLLQAASLPGSANPRPSGADSGLLLLQPQAAAQPATGGGLLSSSADITALELRLGQLVKGQHGAAPSQQAALLMGAQQQQRRWNPFARVSGALHDRFVGGGRPTKGDAAAAEAARRRGGGGNPASTGSRRAAPPPMDLASAGPFQIPRKPVPGRSSEPGAAEQQQRQEPQEQQEQHQHQHGQQRQQRQQQHPQPAGLQLAQRLQQEQQQQGARLEDAASEGEAPADRQQAQVSLTRSRLNRKRAGRRRTMDNTVLAPPRKLRPLAPILADEAAASRRWSFESLGGEAEFSVGGTGRQQSVAGASNHPAGREGGQGEEGGEEEEAEGGGW